MFAYVMVRRASGGMSSLLLIVITTPMQTPRIILGVLLLLLFSVAGIRPGLITVLLGHVVLTLPFATLIIAARLRGIDTVLEEAALDLGASPLRMWVDILLPLLAPAVVAAGLISFTISFDEMVVSYFTIGTQSTLPIVIWTMVSQGYAGNKRRGNPGDRAHPGAHHRLHRLTSGQMIGLAPKHRHTEMMNDISVRLPLAPPLYLRDRRRRVGDTNPSSVRAKQRAAELVRVRIVLRQQLFVRTLDGANEYAIQADAVGRRRRDGRQNARRRQRPLRLRVGSATIRRPVRQRRHHRADRSRQHAQLQRIAAGIEDSKYVKIDGQIWGVPFIWGANAIAYNTKHLPAVDSLSSLFDEKLKGRISMRDDPETPSPSPPSTSVSPSPSNWAIRPPGS